MRVFHPCPRQRQGWAVLQYLPLNPLKGKSARKHKGVDLERVDAPPLGGWEASMAKTN